MADKHLLQNDINFPLRKGKKPDSPEYFEVRLKPDFYNGEVLGSFKRMIAYVKAHPEKEIHLDFNEKGKLLLTGNTTPEDILDTMKSLSNTEFSVGKHGRVNSSRNAHIQL